MKTAYRISELPERTSILRSIAEEGDFAAACRRVAPRAPVNGLLAATLPQSLLVGLRAAAHEAMRRHGVHGWLTAEGRKADDPYLSLSLTYNPDLEDPAVNDVHQSTLGTSVNSRREFYYGSVQRFARLKHSYFDTYGFRLPTPAAKVGALGEFLSGFRLSLVRSRLSLLRGEYGGQLGFSFGWHRDEPVFENLRVNIPLDSHPSFRLQLEHQRDEPAESSSTMSDYYLAPGKAYTWDTHRPHRVHAIAPCALDRVHLVLGFSPWFRYDPIDDAWEPNEFYGRLHPLDIVRSGALHPALIP